MILFTIALLHSSCDRENPSVEIINTQWEVIKIKDPGNLSFSDAEESYILDFKTEGSFTINLDINNCFGSYHIPQNGSIELDRPGCTKICCDSEFAINLLHLLPKMTEYYGKGNRLFLEGEGEIVLTKY